VKRYIILIFTIVFGSIVHAQQRCGTTAYTLQLMEKYPEYKVAKQKVNKETMRWLKKHPDYSLKSIITIPVVVHVVWNTNAENISDAQILSQMDVLNDDFRRTNADASNTPSVWQNIAADCEIDFCLATIAPNGSSTTGITRTQTSQSSFSIGSDNVKSSSTGGVDPWPQDDYLNIWVCDLGGGLLGYATPPSNWTNPNDGVVIGYRYFGTTGVVQAPYNKGRTATHEVGHWLNLDHIWGDNNCGNDNCNDTPVQQSSNYSCPNFPSTSNCTGNGSNGDMFMNYMDYTNDACMNLFTADQKSRMISAINQYRSNLLNHNLCNGSTNPSSWDCINGVCSDPGTGNGTYNSYNACFATCECSGTNTSISEGFQTNSLPTGWSIDNPDGSDTWEINSGYGFNSSSSIFIENSVYAANGQYDDLNSPIMNFTNATTISLSFDYAYSLWTNPSLPQNWSDTLIILVSSDCGLTWEKVWEKAGANLVTTNPIYNEFEWFPSNNNDWKSENINLNNYINSDGVIIKFRNINQYENNLFLDNINISSDASTYISNEELKDIIEVYPNPADRLININYHGLKEIYTVFGVKLIETYDNQINVSDLSNGIYLIKVKNRIIPLIKH
tara:strand:+ start:149 stop:1993 length:1845 start_codon:yes stop_codon:yes gene_type:complete